MSQDDHGNPPPPIGAVRGHSAWPSRPRAVGRLVQSTLLVGQPYGVVALHQQLLHRPHRDYQVIGCCLPAPGRVGTTLDGLPVLGDAGDVAAVAERYDVDTVAVLPSSGLDEAALRRLESDLKRTRADLLLAPAATGTAGSGARNRPRLGGVDGLVKASFDRAVAALLLILLAPVLIAVAVQLKATSPGPVFVRQERVGRDGRVLRLLKFRTDADAGHPRSREPRISWILRRYSLDLLPQLVHVLTGDMSLVGPRPGPLSDLLRDDVHRRYPVKPGLTGVAHVGGGPVRPRDVGLPIDAVRYAENWSLRLDLAILLGTFAAVLRGEGRP